MHFAHNAMQRSLYENLNISVLDAPLAKTPRAGVQYMLYAHVPFCHTFCPYCSFHKYYYDADLAKRYFADLRQEMRLVKAAGFDFSELYVGGGTTLINEEELEKTLILAKDLFSIKSVSCESDPNHIDPASLKRFSGLIDRLSIGVQSFDDDVLKKVARYERFGSGAVLQEKLKKALGVLPTVSIDLIFNMPNQTREGLLRDISVAKSINPDQINFYPLMKSQLTREAIAKALGVSDTDREYEFYTLICESFKDYHQTNAWAFGRSADNLPDEYVGSHHEYLGVGSGAFSFLGGELLINAFNLLDYSALIAADKSPVIARAGFTRRERLKYIFLTELFDGAVDTLKWRAAHGASIYRDLLPELALLRAAGAIRKDGVLIKPTFFGRYLSLVLMRDFYAGMDKVRALFKDDAKIKNAKKLRVMSEQIRAV